MEQKKRIYVNNQQVELALQIALDAHKGQVDLDGKPAILHALAVGLAGENATEQCVGFLHDVVEDSDITFNDLRERGVALKIIRTLQVLTHDKSMPYMDYIRNIEASGNDTALKVKINDLRHNLHRGTIGGHTKQVKKHTEALDYLLRNEGYILHID
jgi:(p)ppGpp synthase/HD superfamily hydrolase